MSNHENQLVSLIIRTGNLSEVLRWGITSDDFQMNEARTMFETLVSTYVNPDTRGAVIGQGTLARYAPNWDLHVDAGENIDHLCTLVRQSRLSKDLKKAAQDSIMLADTDPVRAYALLQEATANYRRIDAGKTTDVNFGAGMRKVRERYLKAKSGQQLGVMPWPWAPLQSASGGIAEDEFAVFYGRPKSMKSWVLMYLITFCFDLGKKVLFYTKEMTDLQCYQRMAAIMMGLPYHDFRNAKLQEDAEAALYQMLDDAEKEEIMDRMICLQAKDVAGRDTPSWFQGKVEKYRPDIAFVDGLYLMSPEIRKKTMQDHERVRELSRAMRQIVLDERVPILATMQANRKAAGHDRGELDEIAFSDALSQDCTMACRVINDKDQPTISLVMAGSREWEFEGMRIYGIPATNFNYHSVLTAKDVAEASAKDSDTETKPTARTPRTVGGKPAVTNKASEKAYNDALSHLPPV
jgi:replicative DNA helicase